MAEVIEDAAVAGKPVDKNEGYRPVGHIIRDLKEADEQIEKACARRAKLLRELREVGDAALSYADNAEAKRPAACKTENAE